MSQCAEPPACGVRRPPGEAGNASAHPACARADTERDGQIRLALSVRNPCAVVFLRGAQCHRAVFSLAPATGSDIARKSYLEPLLLDLSDHPASVAFSPDGMPPASWLRRLKRVLAERQPHRPTRTPESRDHLPLRGQKGFMVLALRVFLANRSRGHIHLLQKEPPSLVTAAMTAVSASDACLKPTRQPQAGSVLLWRTIERRSVMRRR